MVGGGDDAKRVAGEYVVAPDVKIARFDLASKPDSRFEGVPIVEAEADIDLNQIVVPSVKDSLADNHSILLELIPDSTGV